MNGSDASDASDALTFKRPPRSGEDSPWPYAANFSAPKRSGAENADASRPAIPRAFSPALSRLPGRRGDARADPAASFVFPPRIGGSAYTDAYTDGALANEKSLFAALGRHRGGVPPDQPLSGDDAGEGPPASES